jgi:hypothetical protein
MSYLLCTEHTGQNILGFFNATIMQVMGSEHYRRHTIACARAVGEKRKKFLHLGDEFAVFGWVRTAAD